MEAIAKTRWVRVTPRKARLVLDVIRDKNVDEALSLLKFIRKAAAEVVRKVVLSAKSNAVKKSGKGIEKKLFIKEAYANDGVTMKRGMWKAQGRWVKIRKRTSHITVVVSDEKNKKLKK